VPVITYSLITYHESPVTIDFFMSYTTQVAQRGRNDK